MPSLLGANLSRVVFIVAGSQPIFSATSRAFSSPALSSSHVLRHVGLAVPQYALGMFQTELLTHCTCCRVSQLMRHPAFDLGRVTCWVIVRQYAWRVIANNVASGSAGVRQGSADIAARSAASDFGHDGRSCGRSVPLTKHAPVRLMAPVVSPAIRPTTRSVFAGRSDPLPDRSRGPLQPR